MTTVDATAREAAVLDRIEAFRRRRPRLTDDVVTLAHGAGGKASAALVDAVFLDALRRRRPRAAGRRGHARRCRPASGWRSPPTRSWCSRGASRAARSATSPCTARSTTSPCSGATPMWLSAAFVHRGGLPDRRAARDRRPTWPRPPATAGVAIVTGDTKVVGRGAADGLYITTAGVGVHPAGRDLGARARARRRRRARLGHHRPTTAWR